MPAHCAGESFPRAARLLEPADFVRALKTRAQRGQYVWVYRRPDDDADSKAQPSAPPRPRLGMMIGKKNARTSVLRNAIKRRIREQFRLRQRALPAVQYVVRLSAPVKHGDVPAVIAEWASALDREVAKFARTAVSSHFSGASTSLMSSNVTAVSLNLQSPKVAQ